MYPMMSPELVSGAAEWVIFFFTTLATALSTLWNLRA